MNIKAIKEKTQSNVKSVIKSMVGENVTVNCEYDLTHNTIAVLLVEETRKDDQISHFVVYHCVYSVEAQSLSVSGFARRFVYDAFGVVSVTNEPVTVDEFFINGIKNGIAAGLNMPTEEEEESSEAPEEPATEEVVEE